MKRHCCDQDKGCDTYDCDDEENETCECPCLRCYGRCDYCDANEPHENCGKRVHELETKLRTWLQNWKTANAYDLELISVQSKTLGLINIHLAAEEFLDANWGGNNLEPVVQKCLAMLEVK
jgi:hypothetical protein